MNDTQGTRNTDDLLVSVEVMGYVQDRAGATDPLATAAADIAWDSWPSAGSELLPGV
ncbi:hypothetical protein RM717_18745 [Streptomyces griseus]|uniref:Uncharacterized protein n=1 Tax=Streptomyces stephensoniae TaxID=3375367 RepID=A0ABU2W5I6_9ACTN|nr:hypothetical protein [Streptomyces griseus]MDT0492549.1 hypothetical protein [Streptomyces griseus]